MRDLNDFLTIVVVLGLGALIGLSLFVIVIRWRTPINEQTGEFVLRYSPPVRLLAGLLGFVVPVGLLVLIVIVPPPPAEQLAIEAGLLVLKLFGFVIIRETFECRIKVSPLGLISYSGWRRPIALGWEHVAEVRHECPARWFLFYDRQRRGFVVPVYLAGLDALVVAMQVYLRPEVYRDAEPGFALVSRRPRRDVTPPD